jgi:hypothetical protein
MTALRYEKIVDLLAKKTEDNEIEWKESPISDIYQVSFANYSLTISEVYNSRQDVTDYVVSILNSEGNMVDSFSDVDLDKSSGGTRYLSILRDLYQNARRQALGVDKALDEILKELDDDLPF